MTTIGNNGIYVGRIPFSHQHFGNPFTCKQSTIANAIVVKSNPIAVMNYELWILGIDFKGLNQLQLKWIWNNLDRLYDKEIRCFNCKPFCHADVLAHICNFFSKNKEMDKLQCYDKYLLNSYGSNNIETIKLVIKDKYEKIDSDE